jgi:putative lipase involved disintegration of autophagic bodies
LSDDLTDVIGKAIPHMHDNGLEICCHEGLYGAAKMMLDDTLHMIDNFFIPEDYKIVICGHSLGAGVSSLLGMLLKPIATTTLHP